MMKRVIEQTFQAHAADSLRKTLAEVERAASGKLHNESLADYVTRLASFKYDAEQRMAALADDRALMDEWHSVSLENGREPDELMGDYMVRIWTALDVAQRFAEDQKEKLEKAQKEWQERDAAQSKSFNRRLDELAEEAIKQKFRADDIQRERHADAIARIDKLSAQLAEIEAEATECGRDEGESVPKFMSRLVSDLGDERASSMAMSNALAASKEDVARERDRGNRINAEYEADMKKIMTTANELGRADYEALDAFMRRQGSEIARLRSRVHEEIIDAHLYAGTLGRLSTETVTDFMKRQAEEITGLRKRIDAVNADKTPNESLKYLYDCADKLGRGTTQTISDFMMWQAANLVEQTGRTNRVGERLDLVRQELQDKSQQLLKVQSWHEENLQKIRELEADPYRAFMKEELKTARAESLRARTELSEIAKIVNPEAENGPVIDFVQAMNNRLGVSHRFHLAAVQERNRAQEEVRKLSAELAKETRRLPAYEDVLGQTYGLAAAAVMQGSESVGQCLERKLAELSTVTADRDRIRAELAAILVEANKSGRCNGDPVQLLKAGQNDLDALNHCHRENARLSELSSKLQGELAEARDQAGTAQHECSIWNNAALRAGQTLTKLGKLQDENEAQFIERMQGAEFNREEQLKNALAAKNKAQSEDDESHRRFMNLIRMADSCGRLHGESVEQFVARQDQLRVSNMEQLDEARSEVERLSALVAELQVELDDARGQYGGIMAQLGNETPLQLIERMQRLAQDQRASTIPHDERAMLVAESAGLRKRLEESQKAHAKAEHELTDARNGANECGMQAGERLRAFIYRKRAELLDALHASDRIQLLANENVDKLRAALATVASQSAAIAEAKQATEKYTAVVEAAAKLKDWASTIRHKVLVAMVHTKAMAEYDTIMKELDGGKVQQ